MGQSKFLVFHFKNAFFLNVEGNLPSTGGQIQHFGSLLDVRLSARTIEFSAHVAWPARYVQTLCESCLTFLFGKVLQMCQNFVCPCEMRAQ